MDDWPAARFDGDGRRVPFSEAEVDRLVPLMAQHYAPRRFALCEVERDESGNPCDVSVIGWGFQVGLEDDSVAVLGYPDESGRGVRGEFQSAESAVQVLGGRAEIRVAWVDRETT